MRIIHLSDLHIGKRVKDFSMLDDQKVVLGQIVDVISSHKPDALIISGDVYDRQVAPTEAIGVFEGFLLDVTKLVSQVIIIAGNHDSATRLSTNSALLREGVHICGKFDGNVNNVIVEDAAGSKMAVWMLPFIKPIDVRMSIASEDGEDNDTKITSFDEAVKYMTNKMDVDSSIINVIATHQFVTGGAVSESEELIIGGTENVDGSAFDKFDYVALGHLHRPQNVGGDARIRYCGTPLKYSFSEVHDSKSVTIVDLEPKKAGDKYAKLEVTEVPLVPRYDMRELRGSFETVTSDKYVKDSKWRDAYLRVVLTDEHEEPNAYSKLKQIYPRMMTLEIENTRTRTKSQINGGLEAVDRVDPFAIFEEFYTKCNGTGFDEDQKKYVASLIDEIWNRDEEDSL